MTTIYTSRQYNPVSDLETGLDDGLSVRYGNDTAWNLNNQKAHVTAWKLVSEFGCPRLTFAPGDTNMHMMLYLGYYWIPFPYNLQWWTNSQVDTGSVQWSILVDRDYYAGPKGEFDSTYLTQPQSDTITCDTTSWILQQSKFTWVKSASHENWHMYLACELSDSGGTAKLATLDVQLLGPPDHVIGV